MLSNLSLGSEDHTMAEIAGTTENKYMYTYGYLS